jgi:hypothetical protein
MRTSAANSRWQIDAVDWSTFIPKEDRDLYRSAFDAIAVRGKPFGIGGGMAFSAYTRRWRFTKDLDLYIRPDDAKAMIEALTEAGFTDLFEKSKYDQKWSYRGHRGEVIVDLLWGMANYRAWVDDVWVMEGPELEMEGRRVRLIPAEELLWAKLYVVQRGRCDWPDLLNLLFAVGPKMDWRHVLARVAQDAGVVGGLLSLFRWLCPATARELPSWLWERVGLMKEGPTDDSEPDGRRATLIGHSDWFGHAKGPVRT